MKGWCFMKRSPSSRPFVSTLNETALQSFLRIVARSEQEDQPETFAHVHPHAHATARLARLFAMACRCGSRTTGPTLAEIEYGAYTHDIGKYFIAPSVLLKPAALDEDEEAVMRLHPACGDLIISRLPGMTRTIRQIVLYHHEHWDGSGYPEGLSGTAIPFAARIISIADVYTALRARRSYKPTLTKSEAIRTLIKMAERELDPYLVEDFVGLIADKSKAA
jgi:HD-GYP domain-containing protein (c-di-GMP phosphodiesterase class II)